jgi:hypothetical protein
MAATATELVASGDFGSQAAALEAVASGYPHALLRELAGFGIRPWFVGCDKCDGQKWHVFVRGTPCPPRSPPPSVLTCPAGIRRSRWGVRQGGPEPQVPRKRRPQARQLTLLSQ